MADNDEPSSVAQDNHVMRLLYDVEH